ncbi:restriction endonuclease subunit S [Thioalkalivibrio sp. ALMg13-2]|uniref:restriction endonuclease subunit S n=1 Tax=Thioalkalivibrio sp. ALMg13-2 TaxID=1158167 RepID=UPI00036DA2A1|nr:restriction endonuclease subunit S [Thioalkalivibrio sp. ALMg13-2]
MTVSSNEQVIADERARHWRKRKLKFVSSVRTSNVDKHIVEGEAAVRLCNYTDVYYHENITPDIPFMQGSATGSEIERFGLKKGQVLLTKDSESWEDIAVPAYVAETMPEVVCGYHLAVIEPDSDEVDGRFLSWVAQSPVLNDQFKLSAKGVTRFGISQHALKNAVIDVPPLEYQLKVAAFLDRKTAEIDTLIAKKRRLLDRLAEKRTALITRAVTKGLNPDAPMKDSGIEWLGEVPAHWDFCALGQKIKLQRGVDITKAERVNGPHPVISSGGIEYFHDTAFCSGPGVLIGRKGSAGKLHFISTDFWPHDTTLYVREFRGNLPRYVWYVLHTLDMTSFNSGSSNPTVNRNRVHPMKTPWPPLTEQEAITNHLDETLKKMGDHEALVKQSIGALTEYRSALITNAVTGQIKVA